VPSPFPDPCANCGAPLAHDQRYCLTCGERVGPLPTGIAELLGTVAAPTAVVETDAPEGDGDDRRSMVSPRAAALAVLGVLAFGSVLGSAISPAAPSLARAPMLLAVAPPAAAPAPAPAPADTATTPDDGGDADTPAADDSDAATDTSSADSGSSDSSAADDGGADTAPAAYTAPKVKHMFVIMLSGHGYADAFGPDSKATYLAKTLPAQGEVINNYYAATQGELANGIALISGQGPTAQTQLNCPNYGDLVTTGGGDDDQVLGDGCVYPAATKTLGDQLRADGKTWKAYVEDIGNGDVAAGDATTCRHPTLGSPDPLQAPRPNDAYVTWRNPFVYFHSLLDGTDCANSDVGLSQLGFDLTSADTTPAVSFIVPNRCHDGGDAPCADGAPAGMAAADDWLKTTVPQITGSKAFADGGLLAITFDQAPQTGASADATSCCTPAAFPNLPTTATPSTTAVPGTTSSPATTALPPTTATPGSTATPADTAVPTDPSESPGGGRVGLLLLGDAVKPGSVNLSDSYNHFSLLRSIEDLFGLKHLGYAADPAMPAFDKAVYNGKR
jgi:hypothetical protein